MKGTVKWYNGMRGYGFIEGEDGNDVFVHRTAIPAEAYLTDGDTVEFDLEKSDRGLRASNVKVLKNA